MDTPRHTPWKDTDHWIRKPLHDEIYPSHISDGWILLLIAFVGSFTVGSIVGIGLAQLFKLI